MENYNITWYKQQKLKTDSFSFHMHPVRSQPWGCMCHIMKVGGLMSNFIEM